MSPTPALGLHPDRLLPAESIPARHDMSRRLDAGFVAQLLAEHRLEEDEAIDVMHELVVSNPRRAFKL